ncbi:MAG: hypothetical protein QM537_03335 [Candidatus Symbiobacter sp.]|nr:hypothetical protein [Candidatus Symbiobacter sp.]
MRQKMIIFVLIVVAGMIGVGDGRAKEFQGLKEIRRQEPLNRPGIEKSVKRVNNSLEITASNGKKIIYTDGACEDVDGMDCNFYIFLKSFKDAHALIVQQYYYEGNIYYWIDDRTGEVTELPDMPQLSPSGKKFALVNSSEADGYFAGIAIWSLESGKPVMEWGYEGEHHLYSFILWENDDTIYITKNDYVNENGESFIPLKPVEVLRVVRVPEWHIEGLPEASK